MQLVSMLREEGANSNGRGCGFRLPAHIETPMRDETILPTTSGHQIQPPQQVLEVRVVADGVIPSPLLLEQLDDFGDLRGVCQLVGTKRLSSSNQFSTTLIWPGACFASSSLTIRNRPSELTA